MINNFDNKTLDEIRDALVRIANSLEMKMPAITEIDAVSAYPPELINLPTSKLLSEQELRERAANERAQYNHDHAFELFSDQLYYCNQHKRWETYGSKREVKFTQYGWIER